MRIVIKPIGIIILVAAIVTLACLAFLGMKRANAPSFSAVVASNENFLDGAQWNFSATEGAIAEYRERTENVPDTNSSVSVYEVRSTKIGSRPWNIQLTGTNRVALQKGETLRLVFQARSPEQCPIKVTGRERIEPAADIVSKSPSLTGKWTTYTIPFQLARDCKLGEFQLSFVCGIQPGTIEIADIVLLSDKP